MIAGFGAYFNQELQLDSIIGSTILGIISFLILIKNIKGVVKVNEILVPIMIVFILLIGIINIMEIDILNLSNYVAKLNNSSIILSSIIYSSYNSILMIPVLLTLKRYIKSDKQISIISILTGIIILVLSLAIYLLLVRVNVDISNLEMPAIYVVSNILSIFKYFYGFVILGSILTTTISLGASFLQNVVKDKKNYIKVALSICILGVIFSKIGFSTLVNILYPMFGYLGIIQIIKIISK